MGRDLLGAGLFGAGVYRGDADVFRVVIRAGMDTASNFQEAGEVKITLPWPPAALTPNAKRRSHWTVYAPITKSYRRTCWALAMEAGASVVGIYIPMTITFHPPDNRRRDRDGMISAFKAGQDGLADALGVDDHWFRPTYAFGEPTKGGAVVVEFV